jgi:dipeptidyl aminopeptidase/acylaminoacyl peptidase
MRTAWTCVFLLQMSLYGQMKSEGSLAYTDISSVQLSPVGNVAVMLTGTMDPASGRTARRVWMVNLEGGARMTPAAGLSNGASDIRWAPDGKQFAYIAQRAIWVQGISSSHATRVCGYERSNSFLSKRGNALSWSPDGSQLAFAGTVEPAPERSDPIVIDRILYKTRTAISDNRRTHVYIVSAAGGTPRALTAGDHDEHSIDWGGDGKEIVFLSNREKDPDARLNYDVFAVNVKTGQERRITETPGVEYDPVVSPDGHWIACAATSRAITTIDSVAEDTHIHVIPMTGGNGRDVNSTLDRRSTSPQWAADGKTVLYLAVDHGKTLIYSVPAEGGPSRARFDKRANVSAYSTAGGVVLYAMSDPVQPPELYLDTAKISHFNESHTGQFSAPEELTYKSLDGTEVEGWLYPPLAARTPAPMILDIHGGPHGQFGYAFTPAIQVNASHGYATLAINPRGSSGYGQKFSDGTINDWGGGDYKDLMGGVDYVLAHHREIDPQRLAVTGPSYGGYMTNWIITQTNRFKAAVVVSGLSDLISFYTTSLYHDLLYAEFNGSPWDDDRFTVLWRASPLAHVARATTPTLFLHGESDNDVPDSQAEEMYIALRERGVTAELVLYPHEGHGFHDPKHVVDARVRTLGWIDRFLKPR